METTTTKIDKHIEEFFLGSGQMAFLEFESERKTAETHDIIYMDFDDDFVAEVYLTDEVNNTIEQLSDYVDGTGWDFPNGVTISDGQLEPTKTTFTGHCRIFRSGVNKITVVANGMNE